MEELHERARANVIEARRRAEVRRVELGFGEAEVIELHREALPRMIAWLNSPERNWK